MPPSLEQVNAAAEIFAAPPDPAQSSTLDDFVERLRLLKVWALGEVYRTRGDHDQASDWYQQVLDLARELGNGNWQFEARHGLGRLHHAIGRDDLALVHHREALQHATDLAQPPDQARAHDGLADAHHTNGEREQARRHWQHALDILARLDTDRTYEIQVSTPNIRAHLAGLDQPPSP